jgi:mono/diheme cytochrome c family protein
MKRTLYRTRLAALGLVGIALFAGAGVGATSDGKTLFAENKCNGCHSITGAGITRSGNSAAPDLSGVGLRHNAAWMTKYLTKNEVLNGEKHIKKFKGSDADLAVLTAWLGSQKKR